MAGGRIEGLRLVLVTGVRQRGTGRQPSPLTRLSMQEVSHRGSVS